MRERPRRQWERRFAIALYKKMEHLDPSDDTDFDAEDWGFSSLDPFDQDYYLTIADAMYCFLMSDPPPGCMTKERPPGVNRAA